MQRLILRLAALLALAVPVVFATLPPNTRAVWVPNSDNTADSRYPAGNKISAGTLACDFSTFPSIVNLINGSGTFSSSARAMFSGSAAATATLSIVTVSGNDAAAGGWTISGNNLTNPKTTNGAGVLRVVGTTGGIPVNCAAANWSIISSGGTDVTAPTIPTGLTATGGSGNVVVTWDASSDPYVTQAGGGVDQYDLRLGASVVTTLTAQAHGLSAALTQNIIGASSGTPSSTQTGANWSLSFAGDGLLSTADNVLYRSTALAADASTVVKVTSLTTTAPNANAGLMARESTAAGSAMLTCRYVTDGTANIRRRAATGAAAVNMPSTSLPGLPVWLKLARAGDVWTCSYSADGGAWVVVNTVTQAMTTSLQRGLYVTSGDAAINAVAALDQFNLNNVATISSTHSTTVGGSYTVRARDVAGNNSAYSAAVIGTPGGGTDAAPPTYTAQPSGNGISTTSIAWNLGTCTDPSGVATYTPSLSTTLGGTYTDQTPQASNLYTQTGLTAGTTRYLKSKCTDGVGNTTALTTPGVSATTTSGAGGTLQYSYSFAPFVTPFPTGNPWGSVGDVGCSQSIDTGVSRDAPGSGGSFKSDMASNFPDNSHCMIVYRGPQPDFLLGTVYWMGWSMYMASPWVADYFLINMQLHPHNSGTTNNPMLKIDSQNGAGGSWIVAVLGDSSNAKPYDRSSTYNCGTIRTNQWTDFVLRFRLGGGNVVPNPPGGGASVYRGHSNSGFYELWIDGVQCLTQAQTTGLNYYVADTPGPSMSVGTYHGAQGNLTSQVRHMYVDEIRIGLESNGVGYADVVPR